jgi:hypothetical protein
MCVASDFMDRSDNGWVFCTTLLSCWASRTKCDWRTSEAHIGLGFRLQAVICHQLHVLHHLAELAGFQKEKWSSSASFWLKKHCVFVSGSCSVTPMSGWNYSSLVCFKLVLQGLVCSLLSQASFCAVCRCALWICFCSVPALPVSWLLSAFCGFADSLHMCFKQVLAVFNLYKMCTAATAG